MIRDSDNDTPTYSKVFLTRLYVVKVFFFTKESGHQWSSRSSNAFDVVELTCGLFLLRTGHVLSFCSLSDRFFSSYSLILGLLYQYSYLLGLHIDSSSQTAANCQKNNKNMTTLGHQDCMTVNGPNTSEPLKIEIFCIKWVLFNK